MNASAKRSGIDLRIVIVGVVVLLLAFGGAAAWAYTTNETLNATRASLDSTRGDLDSTKTSLTGTEADLAKARSDLSAEQDAIETNTAKLDVLEFQISRKDACIEAQTANLAEIRRILELERSNGGRTTTGSAWYKAQSASNKALDLAISYMAKAYTSAAAGNYSTANSWLSKSNAQVKVSNNQIKVINREIDAFNALVEEINTASIEFEKTLARTSSTCGS
jgi:septal ring factor EnvC (AmiA/AmiB activator)